MAKAMTRIAQDRKRLTLRMARIRLVGPNIARRSREGHAQCPVATFHPRKLHGRMSRRGYPGPG